MFELLQARFKHALTLRNSLARHIRKDFKDLSKSEDALTAAQALFEDGFDKGLIGEVDESLAKFIDDVRKDDKKILGIEEQWMVLTFRLFTRYLQEVTQFEHLVHQLKNDEQQMQELSAKNKQRFVNNLQTISDFFSSEAKEFYGVMLRLARVMRDEYEAMSDVKAGKTPEARLRDMNAVLGSIPAEQLRSKLKALLLKGKARKITKDEKKEAKLIGHLGNIVTKLEGKTANVYHLAQEVEHDVYELAGLLNKDEKLVHHYLDDSRFLLIAAAEHFFKIAQRAAQLEGNLEKLKNAEFPEDKRSAIQEKYSKMLEELITQSKSVMREAYQELHKLEGMQGEAASLAKYAKFWGHWAP